MRAQLVSGVAGEEYFDFLFVPQREPPVQPFFATFIFNPRQPTAQIVGGYLSFM